MRRYGFRPVAEEDWQELLRLEREAYGVQGYSPYFLKMVPVLFGDLCWLAELPDGPCGYALGALEERDRKRGWLINVVVLPEAANQGVGGRLVGLCLDALRGKGAELIRLTVAPDNGPALKLYEKHGFRRVRADPAYYGEGQPRLLMEARGDHHGGVRVAELRSR